MAVPLTQEQVTTTTNHQIYEYEVNESESLTFLYNLLYDKDSSLSQSDILAILNNLKLREDKLPFSINSGTRTDIQGVKWGDGLLHKFRQERCRVGQSNWFYNVEGSRERALRTTNIKHFKCHTEFYKFHKFFTKLKLHINHFQLRNLICCGTDISKGVYYPSSGFHDFNLQTVHNNLLDNSDEEHHAYFKINRLMFDNTIYEKSQSMKLDCLIDSRNLLPNSNGRISTLTCTDKYLACGTYDDTEGGYILTNIEDPDNTRLLGDYYLSDAITNHIIINDFDDQLIISSNDEAIRLVDIASKKTTDTIILPFAVNCAAVNAHNYNEIFITGDDLNAYVIDKRMQYESLDRALTFAGHNDYGFSCDWSKKDENLLLTGNQDGCVRLWDRRKSEECVFAWSGSLGALNIMNSGPVRNCKFSNSGDYISWAESLDHVGIIQLQDLNHTEDELLSRVQSIDFIGKCVGLTFAPIENDYGEQLVIGINDCPLGGILSYKLESRHKSLDFDLYF